MEGGTGQGGDMAQVQAVGCMEQAPMVDVTLLGDGQEREDATAVVIDHHYRQVHAEPAGRGEAAEVVQQGQVAG